MGGDRNTFKMLKGNLAGRRVLGRPRLRLEDNIRMNVKEIDVNTKS